MSRRYLVILALSFTAVAAGQQPRRAPDIHFAPTSPEVVMGMLKLARVTANDVVYDLGSGDGRIVIAAAENYGARGVGIEIDPKLVAEAKQSAERAGVANRVTFIEGDMFEADVSEATVVTLYLLEQINEKLRPKLTRELRPGSRIVSHVFRMGDWRPDEQVVVAGRNVLLWRIPER
jgi:cyclopropane fatty-acyl-phospholipid synthase-like methyltransferase